MLIGAILVLFALKLFLVPFFLLLITLAGKRWGPGVSGWLAGFPLLTGPILLLLALERGPAFAAGAATVSLSAVFSAVAFMLTYARMCMRRSPWVSLLGGLIVWCCAAYMLTRFALGNFTALAIALGTQLIAPRFFPRVSATLSAAAIPKMELFLRMLAGAAVVLAVTTAAGAIGPAWTGMLAVFPVLAMVLAVFSHRSCGPAFANLLLKAMVRGLYALSSFCFAVAVLLPRQPIALSFAAAIALALAVQWTFRSRLV